MTRIDYISLIDELNDEAFRHCKKLLFDDFGYKVMNVSECRKVDLKESLLKFEDETFKHSKKNKMENSAARYANEIKFYLVNYNKCIDGTRAADYKKRAISIIDAINDGDTDSNSLQDLTKIYIAFMRQQLDALKKERIKELSDLDFEWKLDDENVLRDLRDIDFRIPQGDVAKAIVNFVPQRMKNEAKDAVEKLAKSKSNNDKKFVYINAVIFCCISMQKEGLFNNESEN